MKGAGLAGRGLGEGGWLGGAGPGWRGLAWVAQGVRASENRMMESELVLKVVCHFHTCTKARACSTHCMDKWINAIYVKTKLWNYSWELLCHGLKIRGWRDGWLSSLAHCLFSSLYNDLQSSLVLAQGVWCCPLASTGIRMHKLHRHVCRQKHPHKI